MNNTDLKKIYIVMGPTCSSKSKYSEYLFNYLGKENKAKIINFDAFQIYKEMNIGVDKPNKEKFLLKSNLDSSYSYLLFDLFYPNEKMSIYLYQKLSREIISKYNKNYDLIFVGGSGLYIKSALFDYTFKEEDSSLFLEFIIKNKEESNLDLYNKLLSLDKLDAIKIGNNNRKRLLRSLFINYYYKDNKTNINKNNKDNLLYKNSLFIYLNPIKEIINQKIRDRVDNMFLDNKLVNEVNYLKNKYGINNYSFKAIGYKEFFKEENKNDLNLIKEDIIKETIKYSKRQRTFFNNQFNNVNKITYTSLDEAIKDIINLDKY